MDNTFQMYLTENILKIIKKSVSLYLCNNCFDREILYNRHFENHILNVIQFNKNVVLI